jgi:hypothetical protein
MVDRAPVAAAGRHKRNVEPVPTLRSRDRVPFIISVSRRLMVRPSPVPPNLLVVELSACAKG